MVVQYGTVPSVFDFLDDVLFAHAPLKRSFWELPSFPAGSVPYVNVAEGKDDVHVVMEIPGVTKEDVKVQYHNGVLTISGERKSPEAKTDEKILRQEITYGVFSRAVEISAPVNAEEISAEYTNGVLRVTLPKAEEAKPKEIAVR
ncbi:MAG: Hsp20/alpha crystallin family protein [Bacteroidota bacterium]|nr:Hsp20/alpha crystallin family protein [Bacteroidota bacterium]